MWRPNDIFAISNQATTSKTAGKQVCNSNFHLHLNIERLIRLSLATPFTAWKGNTNDPQPVLTGLPFDKAKGR
jgi:hypothetical protein